MGFLADLGRSGAAGQLGQNLLGSTLQYGEFMQRGQQLAQQQQTVQLQQQLLQAKLAEQERLNRPKLLSEILSQGTEKGKPNVTRIFTEAAKMAGAQKITLPDGTEDYTITQADLPNIQNFIGIQKDLHPQFMWAQYQDNQQMIPELEKQLLKAKNPTEAQGIKDQIEKLKVENSSILTEFGRQDGQEAEAPKTREIKVGEELVTQEWNPQTRSWTDIARGPRYKPPSTNITIGTQGKLDVKAGEEAIKNLPKMQEEADKANTSLVRIDKMLGLLARGAGGTTGRVKAWAAPFLESVGVRTQGLTDAQLYETLAKTLGGSMRVDVIGPGPVSEYEQKLLKEVNAGGSSSTGAAKELLNYYRENAVRKIDRYNRSAQSVGEESPMSRRLYQTIELPKPDPDGIR